jgi:hypothetical protein
MANLKQVVGYVKSPVKERIKAISDKNRFLTMSVIVAKALEDYLPKLEKEIAKGMLPRPVD